MGIIFDPIDLCATLIAICQLRQCVIEAIHHLADWTCRDPNTICSDLVQKVHLRV